MKHICLCLLTLSIFCFSQKIFAQVPKTEVSLRSEKGDYIGAGQTYLLFGNLTVFAYDETGDGVVDHVRAFYFTPTNTENAWTFGFSSAKTGKGLTKGFYDQAMRDEFEDAGHPGLECFGNWRRCEQVTGKFSVFDAEFDSSSGTPKVVRFGVTFEQHCEGAKSAIFGTFYFNTTAEPDTQKPVVSNVTLSKKKVDRKSDPTLTITWTSTDNDSLISHDLLLATDGTNFSTMIVSGLPGTTQNFTWNVPVGLPKTRTGLVKVVAKDVAGNTGEAVQKGKLVIK